MNVLKKIIYNCHKATYLIEKQQITPITMREKMELKIHLSGCVICRIFQQQSILINQMVREQFYASQHTDLKLDDKFKQELQLRIEKELNKN